MAFEDYYSLLGLTKNSNEEEIRRAFRRMVLQLHPDKNPDNPAAEDQFKRILAAYQIISNPEKRAEYNIKFAAYEEALSITQSRAAEPEKKTKTKKVSGRKRERATVDQAAAGIDFRVYTSDFREGDVLRGTVVGAVLATLYGAWGIDDTFGNQALTVVLAVLLPWAGGFSGLVLGDRLRALGQARSSEPAPWAEITMKLLPTILCAVFAYMSLWIASLVGHPLDSGAVIAGALAGGLACTLGSAIGRAFTSVAVRFASKCFGLAVGATASLIVGSLLGALLVSVGFANPFDVQFSELLFRGIIGGGVGGALASVPGSWKVRINEEYEEVGFSR